MVFDLFPVVIVKNRCELWIFSLVKWNCGLFTSAVTDLFCTDICCIATYQSNAFNNGYSQTNRL